MASFFGRRYFRPLEAVGSTEKALGLFLALLVAGMVAVYVGQVSTDEAYLFDVDPAVYRVPEVSHEISVAQQMLPALNISGWKEAGAAQAVAGEDLAESFSDAADAFLDFDVQWVYRRRYETAKAPHRYLVALICDAATAAQAMGLCRARRPDDAEGLNVGRDGWSAGDGRRAGFWNGRYYTELGASPDLVDTGLTLSGAAGAVAAVQLSSDDAFPEEALLPRQGRIPGSLRYLHRGAFGAASLQRVFLVDLTGGTTAWVMDAKNVSSAEAIVQDIRTRAEASAQPPEADRYGQPGDGETAQGEKGVTVVPWKNGAMAVFSAGQRVFGFLGPSSSLAEASAARAYAFSTSDAARPEPVAVGTEPDEPQRLFPETGLSGWSVPRKVSRFTPDTLYQKINGRADAYLPFHVVGLTFGTYYHKREAGRAVDVYHYNMGEPINAFGIYQVEAPPSPFAVEVGQEGYQAGGAVFFWKGSSYVQVLPTDPRGADGEVALTIARRLADGIESGGDDVWARSILPRDRQQSGSFKYLARDAFGLDFLTEVFTADYDYEGGRLTLFIHRAGDSTSAEALFHQYLAFFERYGQVLWTESDPSRRMAAGTVSGVIDVVFAKGRYLGGVAGAGEVEAAKAAAAGFYKTLNVDSPRPGPSKNE